MDTTTETAHPNPRDKSGLFSILFFGYTWDIFRKGYKRKLEAEDVYNPLESDRSTSLGDKLERNWKKQMAAADIAGVKPSLLKTLIKTFGHHYVVSAVLQIFDAIIFRIAQPILLALLLDYFKPHSITTKQDAFYYAGALVAINLSNVIAMSQFMLKTSHAAIQTRVAVCSLIYRKSLKLSKTALGNTASGKIMNLLSNDAKRFDSVSYYVHSIWCCCVVTLILSGLLYKDSGYIGFIGLGVVVSTALSQYYTGNLSKKYRSRISVKNDDRVHLMNEIISGIQIIKMYAWEKPFEKIIKLTRSAEIKNITKSSYVRAAIMVYNLFTTRFALFSTLLTMSITGVEITAAKVFVIQSYFNILSLEATLAIRSFNEISEFLVAVERIEDFFLNDEFKDANPPPSLKIINDSQEAEEAEEDLSPVEMVDLRELTVKYSTCSADNALNNINLSASRGHFLGIIGPVGSGKSTLLHTILGEMKVIKGDIKIYGKISYVSQEPWIFDSTVRQNILFGQQYDERKYNDVIKACALEEDLQQLENGDLTIVGDRGAMLSGGQKARINLARAVYYDADIYLLDDPLSAVDVHVAKQLYDNCINGYLSEKIRILVTHQVHFLKDADHIVILRNGHIEAEGTFDVLANSNNVYARVLAAEPGHSGANKIKHPSNPTTSQTRKSSSTESTVSEEGNTNNDAAEEEKKRKHEIQLKQMEEGSSEGKVEGNLFFKYLLAGSNICVVFIIIILFIATQMSVSGVDYFLGYWMTLEEKEAAIEISSGKHENVSNSTSFLTNLFSAKWSRETCLYIYGIGIASLFVTSVLRSMSFYKLAMSSSKSIHNLIFGRVMGTTLRFFETNPGGRILNRFSKDMGSVDEHLPKSILDAGQMVLIFVGCLVLIVVINHYMVIFISVAFVFLGFLRHVYLKSSLDIKRLEGTMKSPVLSHLKASVEGVTTIRAYKAEAKLRKEFDQFQDYHTSACYMLASFSSAFGLYLDLVCSAFSALQTIGFLIFEDSLRLYGGEIGLAITQAMTLTGYLQFGIRQSAEAANQLMSVERVLEYATLPKEVEPVHPNDLPKEWPTDGKIEFINVGLRYYKEGPLILKNLNFTVNPKDKIGIVGRTGAGKSSLITALFRLTSVEGRIIIDGIDTSEITLESLRSKISIIPQDPVLFSGTLKYNLDPFGEHSDEELNKALSCIELKDPANVINQLDYTVMDRGSNYSVGQRQLICLARAILKKTKILVLDEATANVDRQTDAIIQKNLTVHFCDCTVLTIAHRLDTIRNSSKVLVMDSGAIAEFDHPSILLQNSDSVYSKMVREGDRTPSI